MKTSNLFSRSLHDVGLAAWFGGTLANAIALNRAAGAADSPETAGRVANVGWTGWSPVNLAAIGAHLVGSIGQANANKKRVVAQKGVTAMTVVKTGLLAAALAATGYSRILGKRIDDHGEPPIESGTEPAEDTPPEVAQAQRQLKALQWVISGLTGSLIITTALAGEQQRPANVAAGLINRLDPRS